MRIALISDLHFGPRGAGFHRGIERKLTEQAAPLAQAFVRRVAAGGYDFAVQLGDLIEDSDHDGDLAHYRQGLALFGNAGVPVYHVAGNHDTAHITGPELCDLLGIAVLYYAFDVEEYHFVVLHSAQPSSGEKQTTIAPEQLAWLAADLAATTKNTVIFLHHSLADQDLAGNVWFAGLPHECLVENRREVRALLAQHDHVMAVVNGHLHWNHVDQHGALPYITIQSAVENVAEDPGLETVPAGTWAELTLEENDFTITVYGTGAYRYTRHYAPPR
jgi:3',5'-cyclic AMP phosphodiesterase CpdA